MARSPRPFTRPRLAGARSVTRVAAVALALSAALGAEPLRAQTRTELTPARPLGRGTQLVEVNLGFGKWLEDDAPDGSFGFGGGYHFFVSPHVSTGFDLTADRLGELQSDPALAPVNIELFSITGQFTLHAPSHDAVPYLAIGTGPYIFRTSVSGESATQTRWGVVGRTGIRFFAWRPVTALDARYHVVFLDPGDEPDIAFGEEETQFLSLKLTLSWLF